MRKCVAEGVMYCGALQSTNELKWDKLASFFTEKKRTYLQTGEFFTGIYMYGTVVDEVPEFMTSAI